MEIRLPVVIERKQHKYNAPTPPLTVCPRCGWQYPEPQYKERTFDTLRLYDQSGAIHLEMSSIDSPEHLLDDYEKQYRLIAEKINATTAKR